MRPESLLAYVRATPFRPFRIVMNSGKTFEIRHPEMISVGRDVFIFWHAPSPGAPFESWDTISLLLIERLENLEPAVVG